MAEEIEKKRRFVRTPTSARVSIQLIGEEEYESQVVLGTGTPMLPGRKGPFAEENDSFKMNQMTYMMNFMVQMSEKLDRIMEMLENQNECASKWVNVIETIDLSGSGMRLITDNALIMGQKLLIKIALPQRLVERLNILGEVVWNKEELFEEKQQVVVGIQFKGLSEEEQDILIGFTFSEKRKQVRQEKGID
jgi:hypothetical protein